MKLFLSWSKARSNQVATVLREWIPSVIHRVEPWMSSEDIEKGQRWGIELSEALASTSHGLLCVTAENMREPWLSFEAGALAKSVSVARVRPVLLDLSPADVVGPLSQFQATALTERDDVLKLMSSLNAGTDKPVDGRLLEKCFDRAWGELESAMDALLEVSATAPPGPARRPEEKIDEILELVRDIGRRHITVPESATGADAGSILVDFGDISADVGAVTYPVGDFRTVSDFMDRLYFDIADIVPSFTYGVTWVLYDVKRRNPLPGLGSNWARANRRARDTRFLGQAGLRAGQVLRARLIPTEPES